MNYLINQVLSSKPTLDRPVMAFLWKIVGVLLLFIACGCATVPHTGRHQFNVLSDRELDSLALKAFNEVVAKEAPCKDQRFTQIVRRVADRVSKAA